MVFAFCLLQKKIKIKERKENTVNLKIQREKSVSSEVGK